MGAALVLLVAYVILLLIVKPGTGTQNKPVWQLPAADVTLIVIHNHGDLLYFENDRQSGWILSAPDNIPYNRSIAEALPLTLMNLMAKEEITASADSLSVYGLDDPIEIQVSLNDGTIRKLLLGDISTTGDSRYFTLGNGIIYTMDATKGAALALDYLNVRDKNVLGLNHTLRPRDIAARITDIQVNGESRPDLADALARLTAGDFLGEGDFEKYGLEVPHYTIAFMTENKAKTLFLGDTAANGESFYARTSDNDFIFTVSTRGFEALIDPSYTDFP